MFPIILICIVVPKDIPLYCFGVDNTTMFITPTILSDKPVVKITMFVEIENLVESMTPEESKKSLELAVNSWKTRSSLAPKIGKGKYVLAEYEKIKRITMPLGDNHLVYVTTEVESDHSALINRILNLNLK